MSSTTNSARRTAPRLVIRERSPLAQDMKCELQTYFADDNFWYYILIFVIAKVMCDEPETDIESMCRTRSMAQEDTERYYVNRAVCQMTVQLYDRMYARFRKPRTALRRSGLDIWNQLFTFARYSTVLTYDCIRAVVKRNGSYWRQKLVARSETFPTFLWRNNRRYLMAFGKSIVRKNSEVDQNYLVSELRQLIGLVTWIEFYRSYQMIWGSLGKKTRYAIKSHWSEIPWVHWQNEISGYVIKYCKKRQLVTCLVDGTGLHIGLMFSNGEFVWTPTQEELRIYAGCMRAKMETIRRGNCEGCISDAIDRTSHSNQPNGCFHNVFNTSYASQALKQITCSNYLEAYYKETFTEYPDTSRLFEYWNRIGWYYFKTSIMRYARDLPDTLPNYEEIEQTYRSFTEDICELNQTGAQLSGASWCNEFNLHTN